MSFIDKVFDQTFSNHPYLFLFMVLVTGMVLTHSYNVFAQKESVELQFRSYAKSVDGKFIDLELKIDENNSILLELFSKQAIRNYSSDIHTLTELDRSGNANERDRKRLRELKQELRAEQNSMHKRQHRTKL